MKFQLYSLGFRVICCIKITTFELLKSSLFLIGIID